MRSRIAIGLMLSAAVFVAGPVGAGRIPDPFYSFVSKPMVVCPAGDVLFTTIMHTALNNPIYQADVVVSFASCPSVRLPPAVGDEGYRVVPPPDADGITPYLEAISDGMGRVDFAIRAGGGCTGPVRIYGEGELITTRALASFDEDGSLGVGPEDLAIATAKVGTADPTADFDGDGTVTQADLDLLRAHLGHHAPGMATPVASQSWGTLKLLYR